MTTIQVQTELSLDTLLHSLRQLNLNDLDLIERETALLRARQIAPSLPQIEAELLLKINQSVISEETRRRCAELTAKSRQGMITAVEEVELMALVDEIELINAGRVEALVRLAKIRRASLDELIIDLQLQPLSYE